MTEIAATPLTAASDQIAALVEHASHSIVALHGGRRWRPVSGLHWRPGVIVTAEEALDHDEGIEVSLPDGRRVAASLAGRDPSTDIAVLRFQPDGLPVAEIGDAATLRPGNLVLAVGRHEAGPIASMGVVALAGGAWQSQRGGTIDRLLRLDLSFGSSAEGGALLDATGRVVGMTVPGPRWRVLAIPASTIDRVVDQLLAKGRIARGYLGAGLQRVRLDGKLAEAAALEQGRALLVVGVDGEGPAARAGLVLGDVITAWNGAPIARVREVMQRLGPESVGSTVELRLLRGGVPATVAVTIGERSQHG